MADADGGRLLSCMAATLLHSPPEGRTQALMAGPWSLSEGGSHGTGVGARLHTRSKPNNVPYMT